MFSKHQSDPLVMGYVDANYERDLDDMRSTTSYVFTHGGGPICLKFMVKFLVT